MTCKKCQSEMTDTQVAYRTDVDDKGTKKVVVVMKTPAHHCAGCNTTVVSDAIEQRIVRHIAKQTSFALQNFWSFDVVAE